VTDPVTQLRILELFREQYKQIQKPEKEILLG